MPGPPYSPRAHRARAALRAISRRSSAVSFAARAFPPFEAPSFESATACGFFGRSGSGGGAVPVSSPTI